MKIISKKEASRIGAKRFYTGRPCIHGHDAERYVTTGACIECLRGASPSSVRFPVVCHVRDRAVVEAFVRSLADARELQAQTVEGRDEQAYWQLVANYRKLGCPEAQLPRKLGTFALPPGVDP